VCVCECVCVCVFVFVNERESVLEAIIYKRKQIATVFLFLSAGVDSSPSISLCL